MVRACILVVAHADEGELEEPDDRGRDRVARQLAACHVALHPPPDPREPLSELHQPLELAPLLDRSKARVVAVDLPSPSVAAGRHQVDIRLGADPDVGPGRRDHERPDPAELTRVFDGAALRIAVGEAAPGPNPPDARPVVGAVAEAGGARSRAVRTSRSGARPLGARHGPGVCSMGVACWSHEPIVRTAPRHWR